MWKKFLFSSSVFLFLSATPVLAAISINEFSSNSDPEWVELYNNNSDSVDLSGWYLVDTANHQKTLTGTIPGNGYFVYDVSSGWLNNDTDTIYLYNSATPSANLMDSISYGSGKTVGNPDGNKSAGRIPDGSGTWVNNLSTSKSAANIPPPTPGPTNTPTPTSAPTSTPTSTPAPTAVPSATPKPLPTPTRSAIIPTIGEQEFVNAKQNSQGQLLDLGESPPPSSTPSVLGETTSKSDPVLPILIISVGAIGLVVSLILLFFHSRKSVQNSEVVN